MEKINEFLKKPIVREVLDWAVHILLAVVIAVFIVNYVFQITIVNGSSMERCLHDGDRLIVEKFVYKFRGLKRGDIVTINEPSGAKNENSPVIKRVAALEGDLIEIKDGSVYVNNKKLDEPYINGTETIIEPERDMSYGRVKVPEGHIFVLGDNRTRGGSYDSRSFGPVSIKKVGGRAVFRLFPFSGFGRLKVE